MNYGEIISEEKINLSFIIPIYRNMPVRKITIICLIGTLIFPTFLLNPKIVAGEIAQNNSSSIPLTREDLQARIQQKTQELEAVNKQLETTQKNLEDTQNQSRTLQKELASLQNTVNQLDLSIQSDKLSIQKLNLEIDSLNYDLKDTQVSIDDKKIAINKLLVEIQKKDSEESNLLAIFLKNNTLADSVLETQSLANLRSQLALDIKNLFNLSETLNNKIQERNNKKSEIQLRQNNLTARKGIVNEQKEIRKVILAQTKNQEGIYQQQLEELKKQQDEIADEISQIENQLRASFNVSLLPVKRPGVLAWPLQGAIRITQHYGEKSYLYRYKPHNGLDLGASIGTPVFAADDGVIMAVDNNDRSRWQKYQYGKYILIKHNNGLATLYAHLSEQFVAVGMDVKRGNLIGYSGKTGYATGPHLHFGVYWAPSIIMKSIPPAAGLVPVGVTINPEDYL